MLEDTITSSPSKSNKSIREARLKRKNKRNKDQSVQQDSDHERSTGDFHNLINEFYLDSENESTEIETTSKSFPFSVAKPPAIVNDFKPFELEKTLVMADHMQAQQYRPIIFPVTQGFVNCNSLPEAELKMDYCNKANECNNENSSYNITESELLNCCHQAEKIFDNATSYNLDNIKPITTLELTPDKIDNMNLVNSILEDFSQSPLGKEQIVTNNSWQYTPELRLRRKPVKTYSRKQTNLNQCFQKLKKNSSGYDDDHSSCSSLSIQEDVTVSEKLSLPTVTSNTQLLCANLLNLTEYFTQNQSHQNLSDEGQQDTEDIDLCTNSVDNLTDFQIIPDLIKDILSLRSSCRNKKRYDSYNSTDSFYGFSNEENESYIIDTISSDQETRIKNQNITYDINVSADRLLGVSNKEDKPLLYDWPEDDCHDMFACINTENILQDFVAMPQNETIDSETQATHKSAENNDHFLKSNISNQNPANSNCIGFTTASSKPIKVSRQAHIMAAKILSKLPDIPAFKEKSQLNNCDTKILQKDVNSYENSEDYEWNDDCDLFLNIQTPIALMEDTETKREHLRSDPKKEQDFPSTSKMAPHNFKTAGENNVHITEKAQLTTRKLLDNFESDLSNDYDFEEELKRLKFKAYEKTHNLKTIQSDSKPLNTDLGFQTANGKNITISTTAQKNVANILKEFCLESKQDYYEEDLETMKQKIIKKNNEIKQSTTALNCTLKETYQAQLTVSNSNTFNTNNTDRTTANNKTTDKYSKEKQSMHTILEEFNKNSDEDNLIDLKSLSNDIYKRNGDEKVVDKNANENKKDYNNIALEKLCGKGTKEECKPFKSEIEKENSLNKESIMGFQTANGKAVSISAKAQQSVEKFFQEFSAVLNIEHYENGLKEMKTKIQNKNKELKLKSNNEDSEYANVTTTIQCTSSANNVNELNLTPKLINSKRKYSIDNSDSESLSKTPSVKFFKNSLHCSKSSLAEQSLKSPLASTAQPIIMRKNLLTLTKKRKSKRNILTVPLEEISKANDGINDLNVDTDTPIKSKMLLKTADQSPASPNLKEFFSNPPLTSTPRVSHNHKIPSVDEDSELKPINWGKSNDSISNNPSENTAINTTLNSSNPTTKERIDRLKMYGKAPALSPILIETHHNCRPSGLRRTRSMLKKIEK